MKIIINKGDWGHEDMGGIETRLQAIADAGYDGIECFFVDIEAARFNARREELGLSFTGGFVAPTPDAFRKGLVRLLQYDPILINCHGGRDYDSHETSVAFFTECMKIAKAETDVQVVFETHRRTNLYSPWATERLTEALPDLRITADFSHFLVVSEGDMTTSAAEEPDEAGVIALVPDPRKDAMMDAAIARADHIHARVGDLHKPQVIDPRIGEGLEWTRHYERWWDRIVDRARAEGRPFLTFNPEYGPVPYTVADPVTGKGMTDHWDLALWAKDRLRDRYANP